MDNFERIKSMDRDELAKFLFYFKLNKYKYHKQNTYKWYNSCVYCHKEDEHCVYDCMKCWLGEDSKEHGGIDEEVNSDDK